MPASRRRPPPYTHDDPASAPREVEAAPTEHAATESPSPRHSPLHAPLRNWRSALRELVIIVAGVLGALAGQAWWEGRRDRIREAEYIHQLLVDTRENERRVGDAIRADSNAQVALARLDRALYWGGAPSSGDSTLALFTGRAFSASNFEPLTGTYGALVSSGDLRLLHTDSLRAGVVAYGAKLDYEQRMVSFYLQQAFGQPGPLVHGAPFLRSIFSAPDSTATAFRRSHFRLSQLRDDDQFAGFLFGLEAANTNRLVHLHGIRDATRRMLRMLEAEAGSSADATLDTATTGANTRRPR